MKLTDWLDKAIVDEGQGYYVFRNRLVLSNGVSLSVQASKGAYCTPRVNSMSSSDYTAFEIGFPSSEIPLLASFAEDSSCLTETVYPYVPVGIVEKVVEWGGGISGINKESEK